MTKRWVSLCLTAALLLSMLGAAMLPAVLAASASVTGGTLTAVTSLDELPAEDNLLAGRIPYIGDTGNKLDGTKTTLYAGQAAALTDGKVQGLHTVATAETVAEGMAAVGTGSNAWVGSYNGWGNHVWLVYDLGKEQTVNTLLIANSLTGALADAATGSRYVYRGEIYVADTRQNAVNAANRVLTFDRPDGHEDAPAVLKLSLSAAATGRYVAFHFELPNEAAFSETGANDGSGNYRYKTARLSELGAYYAEGGSQPAEPEQIAVTGGTLTAVTAADGLPSGESLIAGKIPNIGHTNNTLDGATTSLYAGRAAALTDGEIQGLHTVATAETVADGMAAVGTGSNAWSGSYNGWGNHVWLVYDMGKSQTVDTVVIANSLVGELAYAATGSRYVYKGEIYVADTRADAVSEAAQVLTFDRTGGHEQAPAVFRLTLDTAAVGRFIAFHFELPNEAVFSETGANDGSGNYRYKTARLSELAVYGSATAVQYPVAGGVVTEVTRLPEEPNRLVGLTPTLGISGEPVPATAGRDDWSKLTDGSVPGVYGAGTAADIVAAQARGQAEDTWVQLTYTLNRPTAIASLLVGGAKDTTDDYLLRWGRIYITDDLAKLYTAESFVMDYSETALAAMRLTLAQPVTGRYVGFSFYIPKDDPQSSWQTVPVNGKRYGKWWQQARISELGVYGEETDAPAAPEGTMQVTGGTMVPVLEAATLPEKTNLLAGIIPTTGDKSKKLSESTVLYGGNAAALTDGLVQGVNAYATADTVTAGMAAVATVNNAWNDSSNGWGNHVWLVFDMGEEKPLDTVLIANSLLGMVGAAPVGGRYVYKGEVYVGATRSQAVNTDYRVLSFDSTGGHTATPAAMLFTLDEAKTGRYVGFHFELPNEAIFSETGAGDGSGNYRYKTARLSELGVYFDDAPYKVALLQDESDSGKLPTGENLLRGRTVTTEGGAALAAGNGEMSLQTDFAYATDGVVLGITQPVGDRQDPAADNKFSWRTYVDGGIAIDLRGKVELQQLLIAADAWDDSAYWIKRVEIYTADTLKALFAGAPAATVELGGSLAAVVTLRQETVCRYVGFRIPAIGNVVRLGELGVYGTYRSHMGEVTNLILNKTPAEEYLCEPQLPDIYNVPESRLDNLSWDESSLRLTDGDLNSRSAWTVKTGDRYVTVAERQYIHSDTPWSVLIYHLGGTATVESITLTSTHEVGDYFVGGADFYVGQTLKTLFDPANRVYTTGGEKTLSEVDPETGKPKLDPATDVRERVIRCELEEPREGRYVAFVVTRPTASDKRGYSIARIDELEVAGNLPADKVEIPPQNTFTDAATGITLTVEQINYDDIDFFAGIGSLRVTTAPWGQASALVCGGWLEVRSDVYTCTLLDTAGQALSAAALGGRTLRVTVPNGTDGELGLGEIVDGQVVRVRNSRTVNGQIIGKNLTGYPVQLVKLGFAADGVIRSGVAGTDVYTPGQVAGAAQVRRLWWLPVLLVPLAGGGYWLWRRYRRERGCRA